MKRLPIYIIVMIVAFLAASFLSAKLNKDQLKFAPEKANLSGTPIAGFHKFASDVQWMRLVNYLGSLQTVDESNVEELFNGYDIICEAFDDPKSKAMLVNQVMEKLPNSTVVASSGMAGYDSCNSIRTVRRMRNLYVCGDFESEAAVGNGLMAPRVQVCAGHQANMILRLLLAIDEP